MKTLLLRFAALILFVSFATCEANYDHIQFVQSWPISFCEYNSPCKEQPLPRGFTLHGLWPADKNGVTVDYCHDNGKEIVLSEIKYLEKSLAKAWPSLKKENGEFWKHEWDKHGTCSSTNLPPSKYFQAAIDQKEKIDVLNILSSK